MGAPALKIIRVDPAKHAAFLTKFQPQFTNIKPLPITALNSVWWVAYDGDKPAAFAVIAKSVMLRKTGYLARAGVVKRYRGLGLQKALIRTRLKYAAHQGWHLALTETYDNPPSANSLISCGFRMYHPKKPWGTEGATYWMKDIR